jgi:hypothetical protein
VFGGSASKGGSGNGGAANGSPGNGRYTMGGALNSPTDSSSEGGGNNSPASGGKPRWQKAAAALAKTRRLYREWLNMDDDLLGDDK